MAGITITNLSKSYGGKADGAAVSNLSLEIRDGTFVTLLGPSGCGKTTTLRLIAGYLQPTSGRIQIGGRVVSSPESVVPPERRGMGMVFQNYAVWPHKTVFENVVFGLRVRKVPADKAREQVAKALALVNLSGLEQRLPNELSGGQQQRVALARSLVVEPEILLLDEPLSNLDAKLRERMRGELKQLQRRTGITFVYVTHDQAEALALSDSIAVMHGGQLQQFGTPQDVYARPANRIVADFMGLVNLLPGRVESIADGKAWISASGGLSVEIAAGEGVAPGDEVEIAIRPENIRLSPATADTAANGTVREHVFLGNISEYFLTLPSGGELRVQTHPSEQYATGQTVRIAIDAGQCNLFPRAPRADLAA
jgi:iron(III) transport system ATP-binding protein